MKIYVETSVPSFYFDTRSDAEMVARCIWTRKWWNERSHDHEMVTGIPVIAELQAAPNPKRDHALKLIELIDVLGYATEIDEIIAAYVRNKVMPVEALGDAAHLALASFHKCDLLLTWNCKHLANANKFGHIRRINGMLGLFTPTLITPMQLLEKDNQNETAE